MAALGRPFSFALSDVTIRSLALLVFALVAGLLGCTSAPPAPDAQGWHALPLPGKALTRYTWGEKDGRAAWLADADHSASMWRKRVNVPPQQLHEVSFSWWVPELIPGSSMADVEREDTPARVLFGFDGDTARLPLRTRVQFELVQALTGEMPPYATLMYVWDPQLPVGTVIVSRRSDRMRKIVVDSGTAELRRWRDHRRDLAADFRRAFGEAPGTLTSIAYMTDSDNTRSRARCWYGPVQLH